ncbi:MAG TPA: glycerol kinase GlpK [Chloroflexota bacterium]|nr:glycerol kinase GlpK [Chloroflexota bacterium]
MTQAVLAIDQGTTRTKAIVFDAAARSLAEAAADLPLIYPRPGWVELDPQLLLQSVVETARRALRSTEAEVVALGLDNQGETVVAWDRRDGRPVYNAIVWQDRRTDAECERLKASGAEEIIRERTGLPVDPYFSATKLRWILDTVAGAREMAEGGDLLAGTTDAWMLWHLTGRHVTDDSTASRTMLYNPRMRDWDADVLRLLAIPRGILPAIQPSRSDFGTIRGDILGRELPVTASLVDQQAALFGQACYAPGDLKVTYGTGAFILQNAGDVFPRSEHGLLPTVAWSTSDRVTYALDGGIYVAGAVVQWLRDELGIIGSVEESSDVAASVPDTGDVVFVPALAGLAAPYWDSYARGTIVGLTRGTSRAQIVRAALEGVAFRTRDVVDAMVTDTGRPIPRLKVDGGASANAFLMQFLADILHTEVLVAAEPEATALGAAFMAGLGAGVWRDETQLSTL